MQEAEIKIVHLSTQESARPLPLSFAQQRLWFLHQVAPQSSAYTVPLALQFTGELNRPALLKSLAEIINRHDNLRTTFHERAAGVVVQAIAPVAPSQIRVIDLTALAPQSQEQTLARLRQSEVAAPFHLEHGPLVRQTLIILAEQEHLLLLTFHRMILDGREGWSLEVLLRELTDLYTAFYHQRPSPLEPLPIQYADYAAWQQTWFKGEALKKHLSYWQEHLEDCVPLAFPTDFPRPSAQTFQSARHPFACSLELTEHLKKLSRETESTLFLTLLTSFTILLARYSGQTDIAIGTSMATPICPEVEALIGLFVNTVVLRTDLSGNPSFLQLFLHVRDMMLDAYIHQEVPFEKVIEALQPERDLSRSPLFQVAFALRQEKPTTWELEQVTMSLLDDQETGSACDLSLEVTETEQGLQGVMHYNPDLFERATIQSIVERWHYLLEGILADPAQPIAELPFLSQEERQSVLYQWNRTQSSCPLHVSLDALFARQVTLHPHQPALYCGTTVLSYQELDQRVSRLARRLRERGVGLEVPVGVYLERSTDLVVAMLAIWRAGGVYVPLDPAYPAQRFAFVLLNTNIQIMLTQASWSRFVPPSIPLLLCEDIWETSGDEMAAPAPFPTPIKGQQHLAYIMYTSGSMGIPKGVMVHHEGMLNHLFAKIETLHLTASDCVAQTASACSDISVWQCLAVLLCGGQLHICPDDIAHDPRRLLAYVQQANITVLEVVPSYAHILLDEITSAPGGTADTSSLRWLIVTGEPLPHALCQHWQECCPAVPLLNAYGPTECSDTVTQYEVPLLGAGRGTSVPIGHALANTQVYLLDEYLEPVPPGAQGQLYIGGTGVGRGYYRDPQQTACAFLPDPFSSQAGARLYRTGDLGRLLSDGTIEFTGRKDQQIKLRGYRIEPGEIEAFLNRYEGIQSSMVLAWEKAAQKYLVAYIVTAPGVLLVESELRRYLAQHLPAYMIPTWIQHVTAFPLLPNGKVNRRALPEPEIEWVSEANEAPRGAIEEMLVDIWCEVLQRASISIHADFFAIGGHSLLAIQIVTRIRVILGVDLPIRSLFAHATIARLSAHIEYLLRGPDDLPLPPLVPVSRAGDIPLSFAQQRLWFLHRMEPANHAYHLSSVVRIYGTLNHAALEHSLSTLHARHESLRTTFPTRDEHPVQYIQPVSELSCGSINLSTLPPDVRTEQMYTLSRQEAQRPFDLARGPLFRVTLLILAENAHVLLITMHQIIADDWSMMVFVRELKTLYTAYVQDEYIRLTRLPFQYADYAARQRQWLNDARLAKQLHYWRQQLHNLQPLDLPADMARPPVQTLHGTQLHWAVPLPLQRRLVQFSQREGVTLFMTLLTSFQCLLASLTGQADIATGIPVACRTYAETERLIGPFANTLVIRTDFSGHPTYRQLLARVRANVLGAYTHQEVPFAKVVEALQPERDLSRSPLFQVMFALQNTARSIHEEPAGLLTQVASTELPTSRFELSMIIRESRQGLTCTLEYNTDLFYASTVQRWLDCWHTLLEELIAEPERPAGVSDKPTREREPQQTATQGEITEPPGPDQDNRAEFLATETIFPGETLLAPRTPLEGILQELWQDLLHLEQVGVDRNFFALGGHSFLAIQLLECVQEICQVELPLRTLFEATTIADLAGRIVQEQRNKGSALDAWTRQLQALEPLELPTDFQRSDPLSSVKAHVLLPLPTDLVEDLTALSKQAGVTLFMTLLTAFQVFLSRLSGQKAFAIGAQEFSASHAANGEQSPFVIGADLNERPTFRQMMHRVRSQVLQAYSYQEPPIEKSGEYLQPEPVHQNSALFQALFLFQPFLPANGPEPASPWPGEMLASCPLTLALERQKQGWQAVLSYHPDLYAASTVECWMQHWQALLQGIVANPDQIAACLPLFTEHELASQLSAIRDNEWSSSGMSNVAEEVSWLALMYPDRVALAQREQQMSYQVLEERANQLAHVLRGCGVRSEVVVGICLPHTPDLFISQFAVLKAGGAYLVLDPALPDEQLRARLEETQAWVILTHRQLGARFHQRSLIVLELDEQWPLISQASRKPLAQIIYPQQLACIVYPAYGREGSEGLSISHAGLSSLVLMNWQFAFFEVPLQDRYTYLKCWGFDRSVWEPWAALVEGDGLRLEPHKIALPDAASQVEARQDGVEMFILDEHLQMRPTGAWGDLYIGGECLARGYLDHADITGERFIPHPYAQEPGERLYRTGRHARWASDGSVTIRA